MLFIVALCFLGGFTAFLPTADSLSCYSCLDYPGSSHRCSSRSVKECGALYDSCVTFLISAEYFGNRYTTIVKNCSISQYSCKSSFICHLVNSSIARANGIMLSCSVNCCYGDLCNGQGGQANVVGFGEDNDNLHNVISDGEKEKEPNDSQGCGGVSNNILTSPGYPNYYPNNMDCSYSVRIPHGMAMKITFNYFNLEDQYTCSYDYLRIKNDTNQIIGTYCGDRSGHVVIVTGNYVQIFFHSDSSVNRMGYNLSLSAVPLGCGGVSNNILTSPGYPNYYPNNMDCSYSVRIPHGMAMKITFNYFNLEDQYSCSYDYLRIKNDADRIIGTYCGDRSGHVVIVTGNYVKMFFHSDSSVNRMGYNLSFSAVPLDAAVKSTGRQRLDVSQTVMVDELKKKAADLMTKLKNKRGHFKRKTQPKIREKTAEKKREAKGREMMKNVAENIAENVFNTD